ncbi:uncharacterized protein [Pyrus communis]|uniref:uncharacterized protein n=1 Tax=Pyrus communis TaxID=23211 RepID=UPI0035C16C18
MEVQCSPFSWEFFYQEEGIEELRHSLLCKTLELETTILSAKEKISTREEEIVRLKDLLSKALQERNEAEAKCQTLVLDKLVLQQELRKQQQKDEDNESKGSQSNKHFTSSDSEETIVPSPNSDPIMMLLAPLSSPPPLPLAALKLGAMKPLPEKGRLLQAVIEAGPLLQTLLLAGPLPQWEHPPPQLKYIEIPPVAISPPPRRLQHQDSCNCSGTSCFGHKGSLVSSDDSGSDSLPNTKRRKLVLH